MALSESSVGRTVEFGSDGRSMSPPERFDRVKHAKERGFLTLLQGGLAIGDTVRVVDDAAAEVEAPQTRLSSGIEWLGIVAQREAEAWAREQAQNSSTNQFPPFD